MTLALCAYRCIVERSFSLVGWSPPLAQLWAAFFLHRRVDKISGRWPEALARVWQRIVNYCCWQTVGIGKPAWSVTSVTRQFVSKLRMSSYTNSWWAAIWSNFCRLFCCRQVTSTLQTRRIGCSGLAVTCVNVIGADFLGTGKTTVAPIQIVSTSVAHPENEGQANSNFYKVTKSLFCLRVTENKCRIA